ncbi:hypothetical protein B0H34DRAFT_685643 [Crassisporium funariophilum]|nr:hypothetical protein B0H34DRAFT_685643 [Crassisporium funariophilum]
MPAATKRSPVSPIKPADAGFYGKLRSITPAEFEAWNETVDNSDYYNFEFIHLDEPHEYPFKDQELVWVRTKEDNWCPGKVTGRVIRVGQTRHSKQGFYYPVNFGSKNHLRKYFAPMNGEIKPNTEEIRILLRDGGWIDDDASSTDTASSYATD